MLKRKRLTKPPAQTAAAFEALEDRSLMDAGLNALFAQLHLGQGPDGQIVRQLDSLFVTEGSDGDGFGLALKE